MIFILYAVILVSAPGGSARPVAFEHEHNSKETCEAAKTQIRENLGGGSVILLTCVRK
jgi:hypothetical protein